MALLLWFVCFRTYYDGVDWSRFKSLFHSLLVLSALFPLPPVIFSISSSCLSLSFPPFCSHTSTTCLFFTSLPRSHSVNQCQSNTALSFLLGFTVVWLCVSQQDYLITFMPSSFPLTSFSPPTPFLRVCIYAQFSSLSCHHITNLSPVPLLFVPVGQQRLRGRKTSFGSVHCILTASLAELTHTHLHTPQLVPA